MRHRPRGSRPRVSLLSFFLLVASLFLPTVAAAHVLREPDTGLPVAGDTPEEPRLGLSRSERVRFRVDHAPQLQLHLGDTRDVGLGTRRTTGDFRNRWYSPQLGRFLTRDPLGYPDGPNAYGAFGADPVNLSDPMGTSVGMFMDDGGRDTFDPGPWPGGLNAPGLTRSKWEHAQMEAQLAATRRDPIGGRISGWTAGAFMSVSGGLCSPLYLATSIAGTLAGIDEAADDLVGIGSGLGQLVSHPVRTIAASHESAGFAIEEAEAAGDYFAAGFTEGGLALDDAQLVGAVAAPSLGLKRAAAPALTQAARAGGTTVVRYGATWALQRVTNGVNAELAANPAIAGAVLKAKELAAAQRLPFIARLQYGNAVERMVAGRVANSWLMDRFFKHVGGAGQPDFIGRGLATGLNFEVTTSAAVARHLTRPYGPGLNVVTYERPVTFVLFPR